MSDIHDEFMSPNKTPVLPIRYPMKKDTTELEQLTIEELLKKGMTNIQQHLFAKKDRRIWIVGETPLHSFMLKIVTSSPPALASKSTDCSIIGSALNAQALTHILKAMQHANKELLMNNSKALKEVVEELINEDMLQEASALLSQVNQYKNGNHDANPTDR